MRSQGPGLGRGLFFSLKWTNAPSTDVKSLPTALKDHEGAVVEYLYAGFAPLRARSLKSTYMKNK
jgi:hypothetical protein